MSVVLPWSTWAITATLRRRLGSMEEALVAAAGSTAGAAAKAREKKRECDKGGEEGVKDFLVEDQRERRIGPTMVLV